MTMPALAEVQAETNPKTSSRQRHVVIVAPHFPPSNLTAGHRTRLFAQHLPSFGFRTTVLTVDPAYYEEPLDEELTRLVRPEVRLVRTRALPVRPMRIVGDLGLRSFWFHYRALCRLVRRESVDLVYLPLPPNYPALLGPLLKRRFGVPYVIDYIDPWVYPITEAERKSWKARLTHWLARRLEPLAVRNADGITGVAESYYAGVVERHPQLRSVPQAGIPYGAGVEDHLYIEGTQRRSEILDRLAPGPRLPFVYAGAILPRALETLRTLFDGCRRLRATRPDVVGRLQFLFVGTGVKAGGAVPSLVAPLAAEAGVGDLVSEIGERQPYLEVLATLARSHAVMVLGSTEPHYTASKIFQALHSRRPVLAMLHLESSAVPIVRGMPGVELIAFSGAEQLARQAPQVAEALERLLAAPPQPVARDERLLAQYSAERMTERLAACFRAVLAKAGSGSRRNLL